MFTLICFILILFFSITFHEYAHGLVAYKLGDSTAKDSGRLTLNPIAHIDAFGTIILPILLAIITLKAFGQMFAFGYAKPVPINPYQFKSPKIGMRWVGLAGPLANICLALILTLILKLTFIPLAIAKALTLGIIINLILAMFNIIPIPPLDGSKILASFLPSKIAYQYLKLQKYGFIFILILMYSRFFNWFILPIINTFFSLMRISQYYPF